MNKRFAVPAAAIAALALTGCQNGDSVDAPAADIPSDPAAALDLAAGTTLAAGSFSGQNNHDVSGGVAVLDLEGATLVAFADDFSHDEAPDPKVGFGNDGEYDTSTTFSPLKSRSGAQVYEVPSTIDVSKYNEVYVWCEEFSVALAVAKITAP